MSALERIGAVLRDGQIDPSLVAPEALRPLAEDRRRSVAAADLDAYAALVERDVTEAARLRALVAVPETWLFRYPASFELLRGWIAAGRPGRFRALSVACATGAEPFSIAATAIAGGVPAEAVEVLAIDPNPDALRQARDGALGRLAARGAIPQWAHGTVCIGADGAPVVAPEVRARVRFVAGRAPEALPEQSAGGFDAVFCRNLAIYLAPEARRAIGARLAELVRPGGLLFLGHAERLSHFGIEDRFAATDAAHPGAFAAERRTTPVQASTAQHGASTARHGSTGARPGTRAVPARAPARGRSAPAPANAAPAPSAPHRAPALPATVADVRALADRGDLRDALDAARRLHDAGNREVGLLELLGTLHLALGELTPAEDALRSAVYLDPLNAAALIQLGVLAERRGDAGQAARYRERAARSSA
jgi:chemotaxis protein methyltransferase WspC